MFTHRPVEESDLSHIVGFVQNARELFNIYPAATYPFSGEQLQKAIGSRFESTVVLLDDDVAGFANFYSLKSGDSCGIGNLIVNPDIRGQGVGTYLTQTMVDLAVKKHSVKTVSISCFADNFAGLLLYTKLGFCPHLIDAAIGPDGNKIPRINFKLEPNQTNGEYCR